MFTVDLPCKPYVYAFAVQNFGNPADISQMKELQIVVRCLLKKPSYRFDKAALSPKYSKILKLLVTEDDYNRYGCLISKTDTVTINKFLERRAKEFLHAVFSWISLGKHKNEAVVNFQETFGFNEDCWSFEAIVKELQRNHPRNGIPDLNSFINGCIKKNLEILYKNGTISYTMFRHYARLLNS